MASLWCHCKGRVAQPVRWLPRCCGGPPPASCRAVLETRTAASRFRGEDLPGERGDRLQPAGSTPSISSCWTRSRSARVCTAGCTAAFPARACRPRRAWPAALPPRRFSSPSSRPCSSAPSSGPGTAAADAQEPAAATEPPRASQFLVTPARLRATGGTLTVHFRIEAATAVRVGLALTRRGARRPALRLRLGWLPAGRPFTRSARVAPGRLTRGAYVVSLLAVDARRPAAAHRPRLRAGRREGRARHRAGAGSGPRPGSGPAPAPTPAPAPAPGPARAPPRRRASSPSRARGRFGGDGSRFARRPHRPLAPGPGHRRGRGHAGRRPGTGRRVARRLPGRRRRPLRRPARRRRPRPRLHAPPGRLDPGREGRRRDRRHPLGRVGSTGTASGPHLHFEIWPDGWSVVPDVPADRPASGRSSTWAGTR